MGKGFQENLIGVIAARPGRVSADKIDHYVLVDEGSAQPFRCDRPEDCHRLPWRTLLRARQEIGRTPTPAATSSRKFRRFMLGDIPQFWSTPHEKFFAGMTAKCRDTAQWPAAGRQSLRSVAFRSVAWSVGEKARKTSIFARVLDLAPLGAGGRPARLPP